MQQQIQNKLLLHFWIRVIFKTVPAFVPALRVTGLISFDALEDRSNFSMYFTGNCYERQTLQ